MTLKAVPVDDSDVQKADIQDDILDYVLKNSRADIATDWAYEMAVKGGFGFVLLTTDYTHESTFDQDILIKRIENPQSTYISPESKDPTGADATEAITGEWLTKEQFKRQFPDAEPNSADDIDSPPHRRLRKAMATTPETRKYSPPHRRLRKGYFD